MSKTLGKTKPKPQLRVGDIVSLRLGADQAQGEILEDRGPLAAEGRRLFRIRIDVAPDESLSFEMPEDELSPVK
jgi:hypothetical protein